MVVVSHEGILKDSKFSQFLRNAVEWLKPSPEALVGVHPHLDSLSQLLLRAGTAVQAGAELSPSLGVYCMDAYGSARAKDLVGFVAGGGGLLVGGQAWHWASQHGKEKVLLEFPGNQSHLKLLSKLPTFFHLNAELGETDVSAWQSTICHYPAPWAELATEDIILTVPAADVHHMNNPASLLSICNKMMYAIARLAVIPATFPRPERMVADVHISHGWMHAGNPVMHHLKSVTEVVGVRSLEANGLWGAIHELGHNQQQSEQFSPHASKATCSLWSVYMNKTVLGIPKDKAHNALALELRKKIRDYLENGSQLKYWEVFTALETYLQVQEAFDWEALIKYFEYQNMSELPDDNDLKMNLWAETFFHLVKKNLTPFFKSWGWPPRRAFPQLVRRSNEAVHLLSRFLLMKMEI
ncbi:TRPM8 channel-associated factor 2-like [Falco cherrug]|uniref:TRPM8 channel-associated factor 2-like n=1 Tax=Falco cherrug TaxID=345164 RepID=UPI00247AB194|nr:TRPM8 channel-associated factor 2-like [Falco cherrug]